MKITEQLLNEKIMTMLRGKASCVDARSIMLELVSDADAPCNWRIGHFDPGTGDRYTCKISLRRIQEELQAADYEMVGES